MEREDRKEGKERRKEKNEKKQIKDQKGKGILGKHPKPKPQPARHEEQHESRFILAFLCCFTVSMAHPCTPCLGRAIPGIAQMLLACLPISAIMMMAPHQAEKQSQAQSKG